MFESPPSGVLYLVGAVLWLGAGVVAVRRYRRLVAAGKAPEFPSNLVMVWALFGMGVLWVIIGTIDLLR